MVLRPFLSHQQFMGATHMASEDCTLRDTDDRVWSVGPTELCFRFLKQTCPDGAYTIKGPGVDIVLRRQDGVVYPVAGTIDKDVLRGLTYHNPEAN
jgi:hypothetical protein